MHYCTLFTLHRTTVGVADRGRNDSLPQRSSSHRGGATRTCPAVVSNRRYNCRTIRTAFVPNRQTAITVYLTYVYTGELLKLCNFAGRDLYNARQS